MDSDFSYFVNGSFQMYFSLTQRYQGTVESRNVHLPRIVV
jgi:hypothetical protein